LDTDIHITNYNEFNPINGDFIVVKVIDWGNKNKKPSGEITRFIGSKDTSEYDAILIANQFGIPEKFSDDIHNFVKDIPENISLTERKDFRDLDTFTIDPEDAKDFDDAVSLTKKRRWKFRTWEFISPMSVIMLHKIP